MAHHPFMMEYNDQQAYGPRQCLCRQLPAVPADRPGIEASTLAKHPAFEAARVLKGQPTADE
jgi:hypothetical protein